MTIMTSRQRLLNALSLEEVDHLPCSFMSFAILRKRCGDDLYRAAQEEIAMGLDPMLFIPMAARSRRPDHPDLRGLPVRPGPQVSLVEWKETEPDGALLLHKEYRTPAGVLSTAVRTSEDWPHGDHIPMIDDYQIPRATKPLVSSSADLEALPYLLTPPQDADIQEFRCEAEAAHSFSNQYGVLLGGGWGVGIDMANWLCGMQNLMELMFDQPELVDNLLQMIHEWNMQRMQVVLSAPVDVYFRRSWYEGSDFITPNHYRRFILPRLKREVELVHDHGAKMTYICSSGNMPFLDLYLEAGIDALVGIDPVQGTHTNLEKIKSRIGDKVCLWGGVSGAVTVEMGSEAQVRQAVDAAVAALGPRGFILSPVDNLTVDEPQTWKNVEVFIDQWRKHW